jgi:hypothetical protein
MLIENGCTTTASTNPSCPTSPSLPRGSITAFSQNQSYIRHHSGIDDAYEDGIGSGAAGPSAREHPAQQITDSLLPTPLTSQSNPSASLIKSRETGSTSERRRGDSHASPGQAVATGEGDVRDNFSVTNAFQGAFDGLEFDFDSMSSDPFSWFTGYRVEGGGGVIDALAAMGD